MADEPVTISAVETFNLKPGFKYITGLITGGTDYDADPGQLCDLSSYFQTIHSVIFGGATLAATAKVYPTYVNDDFTDADGGAVVYTWDGANSGGSESARVFENVADTTNMSAYAWRFVAFGTPPTRS